MKRLYLLPILREGNQRFPAYIHDLVGVSWSGMDYGNEPVMLVQFDAHPMDHEWLETQPDVIRFPDDMDASLPRAWAEVHAERLEARNIPADVRGTTREVVERIAYACAFAQRYQSATDEPVHDTELGPVVGDLIREGAAHAFIEPGISWWQMHKGGSILEVASRHHDPDTHIGTHFERAGLKHQQTRGKHKDKLSATARCLHTFHHEVGNFVERFRPFRRGARLEQAVGDLHPNHRAHFHQVGGSFGQATTDWNRLTLRQVLSRFHAEKPVHLQWQGVL